MGHMSSRQLNILLVDRDEQLYNHATTLLNSIDGWQFNLDWETTGENLHQKIAEQAYDLCLLELDFWQQANTNGLHTPLIILVDQEKQQLAANALSGGAVDYLLKNQLDAFALERSIRYTLAEESLQKQLAAHKKLEQELAKHKKRERQYRLLFDLDIDSVEMLNAQGKIIDCNRTFQHLLGYSREEIVGRHTTDFMTEASKGLFAEQQPVLEKRGYAEGEVELLRRDGSVVIVWRQIRTMYSTLGKLTGFMVYNRDITERTIALKQISTLTQAIEQNPVSITITNPNGQIEYANLRFTELTGYNFEEVEGKMPQILKPNHLPANLYRELWDTITAGYIWEGEMQNRRKNGQRFWESLTIAPLFGGQGHITHFVLVEEDIEARRQLEQEMLDSQRRIGNLVAGHISELTTTNERLQREIIERHRIEQELRQSKSRLRAQYKGIPVPTYSWQRIGMDFVLVDYNDAAEKASHGRIAQFLHKTAAEVFQERPQVLADFARCHSEKTFIRREAPYRLVTTGETRYFVTTYNFVPPDLIIVHIQDITEHKQVEAELNRYRNRPETQMSTHISQLAKANEVLLHEIARREQAEQALRQAEERLKHITTNIDEKLKEQYRGIPIPTYSWQRIAGDFILVDFNDAAAVAMRRIVDFLGKPAGQIFKDRPEVLADFARCFEEKRMVKREAPYKLVTSGETRHFVTTYNFIPPNLVIVHIQDITDQKRIEAELKAYRQRLTDLQAGKSPDLSQALQQEVVKREEVEQNLRHLEEEFARYQQQINELIQERVDLSQENEQLQQELARHDMAEEAVRQSRARLRAQYKGIPIPTYSWQKVGKDFVLVDYNDAAEENSQGHIVDFLGKTANEIFRNRSQILADFTECFDEKKVVKRESPYQLLTTEPLGDYVLTYNFVPPNLVIVYMQSRYSRA